MRVTERELWLLNFYRNSELHGAMLMGKLGRSASNDAILLHATQHCATEAHHAALLSEAVVAVGGRLDPTIVPVQQHYSAAGGVPKALVDLLVLSEVLEHRVLTTYQAHVQRSDLDSVVRQTLQRILAEMEEEHGAEHAGWIEQALRGWPADRVEAAEHKWRGVDAHVALDVARDLDTRFPRG
jgi:bacterioferritin (cytochrome b1)